MLSEKLPALSFTDAYGVIVVIIGGLANGSVVIIALIVVLFLA